MVGMAYHNTTAHYNSIYYSREEIRKIEKGIWAAHKDDYNRILRIFPTFDSALAKGYDKEAQEAIKMASLAIQRHPNSKWVDDGYLLVGKARLYTLDWGNAITTFKYVNTKSKDPEERHRAIIMLIRTFVEHEEFNNAKAAIDYLEKEDLSRVNKKSFALEKAYYYQLTGNLDYMVRNLTAAETHMTRADKPGRIHFIIGQVYQKLGFEAEAFNYYRKCIATNPEYETDFYARLYMAQVTEISKSRNIAAARKSFKKLLKDTKNKEFKDKIYYELGIFELKNNNLKEGVATLNQAIREGSNKQVDGESYLRLGILYYDSLKNYELSQAYYDSAISSLPTDYEGYAKIKSRQEILDEFVKNLRVIKLNDSLIQLQSVDTARLHASLDSLFRSKVKVLSKKESKRLKRESTRVSFETNSTNPFATSTESQETSDWYFGNPTAVANGQLEFKRIWGNVSLDDNWRRSQRQTTAAANKPDQVVSATDTNQEKKPAEETTKATPESLAKAEFDKLIALIPKTKEDVNLLLQQVEDAYFNLGDIYYFKLLEPQNAIDYYKKLLARFPDSEHEPEVLYKLYLLYKDLNPTESSRFAQLVISRYPKSDYARILINPNYRAEAQAVSEKQMALYKNAYANYEEGNYRVSKGLLKEAKGLGETDFIGNLELLEILIDGKLEDLTKYQFELEEFIKKYPDGPLNQYAKNLLKTSREFKLSQEVKAGVTYIKSLEEPHYYVIIYRKEDRVGNEVNLLLKNFNAEEYPELNLKSSNLIFTDEYIITFVSEIPRVSIAIGYINKFKPRLNSHSAFAKFKFPNFVITKDNFEILYRTKGLDEYLKFFEKYYPAEAR